MTEQEAIELHISENIHRIEVIEDFLMTNSDANDKECRKNIEVLTKINKALEEIQQYRAIGTPEKIKEELDRLRNDKECQGLYFTFEERQDLARQHKELEKYRAIGKVDECRAAVEKQRAKKPDFEGDGYADGHLVYDTWICPCCGKHYEVDYDDYDFCPNCGQKLDWSDEE